MSQSVRSKEQYHKNMLANRMRSAWPQMDQELRQQAFLEFPDT